MTDSKELNISDLHRLCFENPAIAEAYAAAARFDEGAISRSPLYDDAYSRLIDTEDTLREELSPAGWQHFLHYQNADYDCMEFECMHFFLQGWQAGHAAAKKEME